ncbi:unnamed protein product [Microthlaspi erraticum]|uniref:Uncharacterized protein n=1 Tax=Microthlaspi erraticum TaxID=1685480 RepID=A0A6D2HJF8_9BRAS|nr:unnamed protein product [Microthlaspi erraticum]
MNWHKLLSESALSKNPRSLAHEARQSKQNLNKPDVRCKSVPETSRPLQMKRKFCEKNATEMLELFEIAKKSADVANAKGLLLATKETSICVDTLALLIEFPISSTAKIIVTIAFLFLKKHRKSLFIYHHHHDFIYNSAPWNMITFDKEFRKNKLEKGPRITVEKINHLVN